MALMRARGRAAAVAFDAGAGLAGRGGGAFAGAAAVFAAGQPATFAGGVEVESGVPQRAQNLKVGALSDAHFGHCFCGPAPACARGAGAAAAGFTTVGADASVAKAAPHERQEPTSVSFHAPHFGQSMWLVVVPA
jgi:hypothetical protein